MSLSSPFFVHKWDGLNDDHLHILDKQVEMALVGRSCSLKTGQIDHIDANEDRRYYPTSLIGSKDQNWIHG